MTAPAVRPETTWAFCALVILVAAAWPLLVHRSFGRRAALATADGLGLYRGYLFGAYFLLIGVVSMFAPAIASWMPLGIIALSIAVRPVEPGRRRVPGTK